MVDHQSSDDPLSLYDHGEEKQRKCTYTAAEETQIQQQPPARKTELYPLRFIQVIACSCDCYFYWFVVFHCVNIPE